MSDRCCEGIEVQTPLEVYNRPGLTTLNYRAGTHSAFLQTMKARLSSGEHSTLTARDANDPAIAILDAWATVAHVLCFYQERICNENYLKTATEPRSVLELTRLLGYVPPPAVAASVHLVFTMQEGYEGELPKGTRAQSVPRAGEQGPQAFETSEALQARAVWNALTPRLHLPQSRARLLEEIVRSESLYLKGVDSTLGPNAPILIDLGPIDLEPGDDRSRQGVPTPLELFLRTRSVETDLDADRTLVTLQLPTNITQRDVGSEEKELLEQERKRAEQGRNILTYVWELIRPQSPTNIPQHDVRFEKERLLKKETELFEQITELLDTTNERLKSALGTEGGRKFQDAVDRAAKGSRDVLVESAEIRWFLGALTRLDEARDLLETLESWRTVRALRLLVTWPTEDTKVPAQPDVEQPPPADVAAEPTSATVVSQSTGGGEQLIQAFAGETGPDAEITPAVTDAAASAFEALAPERSEGLFEAPANVTGEPAAPMVHALRSTASLFGYNAPKPGAQKPYGESRRQTTDVLHRDWRAKERPDVATLDSIYKQILPDSENDPSWIVFEMARKNVANEQPPPEDERSTGAGGATGDAASGQSAPEDAWSNVAIISRVKGATERSRADYGITSARSTGVMLDPERPWFSESGGIAFEVIRRTSVHAQSEPLELAEISLEESVRGKRIELDTMQKDLKTGRLMVVSGEPQDRPGVLKSEAVELESVEHVLDGGLLGGRWTSTLVLKKDLVHSYKRNTVRVHANVARATHGETHTEVLGSGDSRTKMQRFTLRQSPLTYLPAPDSVGGKCALEVRVDKVDWQEARSLIGLGPKDRRYVVRTNEVETTLLFGDGSRGALIPSGTENVEAVYRTGSGQSGNVEAGQISQLATRPLGVTGVTNPMPATGGADREPSERRPHECASSVACDGTCDLRSRLRRIRPRLRGDRQGRCHTHRLRSQLPHTPDHRGKERCSHLRGFRPVQKPRVGVTRAE